MVASPQIVRRMVLQRLHHDVFALVFPSSRASASRIVFMSFLQVFPYAGPSVWSEAPPPPEFASNQTIQTMDGEGYGVSPYYASQTGHHLVVAFG